MLVLLKSLRPLNGIMAAIAVLIGIVLAGGTFIPAVILALITVFIITGAGMLVNDYFDFEIDKINKPKKYRKMQAYSKSFWASYAIVLFGIGISLTFFINISAFVIAVVNSILLVLYSWKLKKQPLIGNIAVSFLVASTFLFGGAVMNNFSVTIFLALLAFLSNTGREIVKDIEDIKGDSSANAKTLPVIAGKNFSLMVSIGFIFSAILLSPLPFLFNLLSINYFYIVLVADIIFSYSCFMIFISPGKAQKMMKAGMLISLIAFIFGII